MGRLTMNEKEFFNRVEQEQQYLAYGDYSFEDLLRLSLNDRRVRNAFVFHVLSKPEYYEKFLVLAEKKTTVRKLQTSLYNALVEAEKKQLYRPEVRNFAKLLRNKYLHQSQVVNNTVSKRKYDESQEMEKFFVTVVNFILNQKEENPDRDAYVSKRMKEIDFDNLFITK